MRRNADWIAVIFVVAVGCGSPSPSAHATPSPHTSTGGFLVSLGKPGCAPAATFRQGGMPETGTNSSRGSLWALFFSPVPPSAGADVKVVWRMTSSGTFVFRVSDATGQAPLLWGPEPHEGSTWVHPGDEVGTGFNFPRAGCWQIASIDPTPPGTSGLPLSHSGEA